MKLSRIYLLFLIVVLGWSCKRNIRREKASGVNKEDLQAEEKGTNQDSVCISLIAGEVVYIKAGEIDMVKKDFPEMLTVVDPDSAYNISQRNNKKRLSELDWDCEIGMDYYFLLHYYFSVQRNNSISDFRRDKLQRIFCSINSFHQRINQGGTGYGHSYSRIPAYAEHKLGEIDWGKDAPNAKLKNSKKEFFDSLKSFGYKKIDDIVGRDEVFKYACEAISDLDSLIDQQLLLECAIEFNNRYQ